jgi:hypothetical protein
MEQYQIWQYQTETHSLALGKAEMPTLDDNEILVQNKAIGINPTYRLNLPLHCLALCLPHGKHLNKSINLTKRNTYRWIQKIRTMN